MKLELNVCIAVKQYSHMYLRGKFPTKQLSICYIYNTGISLMSLEKKLL